MINPRPGGDREFSPAPETEVKPGDGAPMTLAMQPRPTRTRTVYHETPSGDVVTIIDRDWAPGAADYCRLCLVCTAYENKCVHVFDGRITNDVAPLQSDEGYARRGGE